MVGNKNELKQSWKKQMATSSEQYVQTTTKRFNLVRYLRAHGFKLVRRSGVWVIEVIGDS